MTQLLGLVAPVFVLIAMGWFSVQRRWVDKAGIKGLTDFAFFAALPALLFGSIAGAPPLHLANVAGSFLAGALGLFFVAMLAARFVLRESLADAAMFGLTGVYGNVVMMGIPVIQAAYGPVGVANLLAVVAFHSATLLPLATVLIEIGQGKRPGLAATLAAVARGLFRNPIVVSVFVAMVWRGADLPIPAPLHAFLKLLGGAAVPVALFCLGASLPHPRALRQHLATNGVALVAAVVTKLVVMPVVVAAIAYAMGLTGVAFATVVLAAAMPTGANAFLLARQMNTNAENTAAVALLSTVLFIVTLTVLLGWLR